MTFLSTLALAVGLLAIAPYMAHRLRRRRAEEQLFPAARLVPPAPPNARRRPRAEARALLATRGAAIFALALLGATPFVRCSRLALQRTGGASIGMAIVVDDSMSMRVDLGGRSRFERARDGAREILASAREGDAVAVVLGGAPARVELAATTDLGAARRAIDSLAPSDRATDLEGAIALARGLLASLPQVDRRVVLLSDLADGQPDGPPLGESAGLPIWVALPEMRSEKGDCGIVQGDQRGVRVRVEVACGPGVTAAGREVVVEDVDGKALARGAAPSGSNGEANVLLASGAVRADHVRLTGDDAVASDDTAPVIPEAGRSAIAVVVDQEEEAVATGGAPIVEQALGALKLDIDTVPIPILPDRVEDFALDLGVLLDDPPGFTPEQRHALGAFVDGGGVVLIALGPRGAAAPLGATLEPVLTRPVFWSETSSRGADPATAVGPLAESAMGLVDLGAPRHAVMAREDASAFDSLIKWTDGSPLVAERVMGRGEAWVTSLPFSVDASDLTLRPAFLALLGEWVSRARERAAPQRGRVGIAWTYPGVRDATAVGRDGPLPVTFAEGGARMVPPVIGAYRLTVAGKKEMRVASVDPREMDLRPRPVSSRAAEAGLGERRASVDISGPLALGLLALLALEMALRISSRRRLLAA